MANIFKIITRYCSTNCVQQHKSLLLMGTMSQEASKIPHRNLKQKELMNAHIDLFPQFVEEASEPLKDIKRVFQRFKDLSYYNGTKRELYPSLAMVTTYGVFENTSENLKKASMLFWSFEALTTSIILQDDYFDSQKTRWKKSCWHTKPEVGMSVVIDCNLLRSAGFYMLQKYFQDHPSYTSLMYLLSDFIKAITLGQILDMDFTRIIQERQDFQLLTPDKYHTLVKYKSYIPLLTNPTLAVMHLTNHYDIFNKLEHIFEKLGPHLQIVNDMWDCYGNYESFGRTSTDIAEGKCSWLLIEAMKHANDEQKCLLQENYGKPETECQQVVRDIYKNINIVEKFFEYKTKLLDELNSEAQKMNVPEASNLIQAFIDVYLNVNDDFRV